MAVALHAGPDCNPLTPRAPHPDFVALCLELQGGPALPMTMPVTQRIADVWRGPGTWEERMLATMKQCQAEGPTVWLDLTGAVVRQHEYEDHQYRERFAELDRGIASASTEVIRQARVKAKSRELRDYWSERLSPFRRATRGDDNDQIS